MGTDATSTTARRLIALDFDETIAAQNTDLVARDLLDPSAISEEHRRLYTEHGWTDYMQAIFRTLHAHRIDAGAIRDAIRAIAPIAGMVPLIADLVQRRGFDAIIISDSNSEFIAQWNEANGLAPHVLRVFTNPAEFDATGMLQIRPHHQQTECTLSTVNLCKGRVLEEFLRGRREESPPVEYAQIFYVGDGRNDVCPTLRLVATDWGCARRGFRLDQDLQKRAADGDAALRCGILSWTDGVELLGKIRTRLGGVELHDAVQVATTHEQDLLDNK